MAETSAIKKFILPHLPKSCFGIDIGFGNDKIREDFIGADMAQPYSGGSGYKVDIICDVEKGIPVPDGTFDVVYSSHLIEDFENTVKILREFIRIGKHLGLLVLVFPDQRKYELFCSEKHTEPDQNHKIKEMGLDYMHSQMNIAGGTIILRRFEALSYNCVIIARINKALTAKNRF